MQKPEKIKTHADGCRHYRYPNSCDCGKDDYNQGLTAGLAYCAERVKGIVEVYEKYKIHEGELRGVFGFHGRKLWQAIKTLAEGEKR